MVVGIDPMSALSAAPRLPKSLSTVNAAVRAPARIRCTEVLAAFDATEMHVATAADRCALHCHTHQGTVIIRLPLAVLVERARGPLDGNGHPFPISEASEDKVARLARECAIEPGASPVLTRSTFAGCKMPPARREAYQTAFDNWLSGHHRTKAQAARAAGIADHLLNAFQAWTCSGPQRAYAEAFRRPVLKPNGSI